MTKPIGADVYIQRMIDRDTAQKKAEIAKIEKQLRHVNIRFAFFLAFCAAAIAFNVLQFIFKSAGC